MCACETVRLDRVASERCVTFFCRRCACPAWWGVQSISKPTRGNWCKCVKKKKKKAERWFLRHRSEMRFAAITRRHCRSEFQVVAICSDCILCCIFECIARLADFIAVYFSSLWNVGFFWILNPHEMNPSNSDHFTKTRIQMWKCLCSIICWSGQGISAFAIRKWHIRFHSCMLVKHVVLDAWWHSGYCWLWQKGYEEESSVIVVLYWVVGHS